MSKSLVQLIQDLHGRVSALEAKAKATSAVHPDVVRMIVDSYLLSSKPYSDERVAENLEQIKKSERKMCPKCGVKPNHFFHVKTCSGTQKEEQIDASSDGPGSKHST